MDPGQGYPHNFIPPQQFAYHPGAFPFGVPPSAAAPVQAQGVSVPGFFSPWEIPPPPAPTPSDADLQTRIDKLVEYAAKNGPPFEALMKDKQKENPAYAFLFGAEGHDYYRYRLWISVTPQLGAMNASTLAQVNPNLASLNPSLGALNPALNAALSSGVPPPPQPGGVFRPTSNFFPQQQQPQQQQQNPQVPLGQPYFDQFQHEPFGQFTPQLIPATGPVPPEVLLELKGVLDGLTGTKESIKGAKMWFMQRVAYSPALAEAMRDRVLALEGDVDRQLHVIYLANDILFNSLQHRSNPSKVDNEALAFRSVLGPMLAAVYHNRQNPEANQEKIKKILLFWGAKEVYDTDTINTLEGEMVAGPVLPTSDNTHVMQPAAVGINSIQPGSAGSTTFPFNANWQADLARAIQTSNEQQQPPQEQVPQTQQPPQSQPFPGLLPGPFFGTAVPFSSAAAPPQFVAGSVPALYPNLPGPPFLAPIPAPVTQNPTPALAQLPSIRPAEQSPYPLFPPGLIPGMVRKMQIGSGVPYSPLSPLDIPTVIPPASNTESYILERVAKFFKAVGEVDPLEGQVKEKDESNSDDDGEEKRESREGGARIPPPGHMQVDPGTGALPDGSVEHRPGVGSTGRLGLGASADPNEVTQYDDVYTSYRKQRSTNYHTSLSARAAAAR